MSVFGDVNVSVYGNSDVLKLTFTFKCVLLENQTSNHFNHLLCIAALYLLFIPVSFIKFNPLSLSWWYFLQNSRKVLFQAATSQSGKQLHVPRLYIILLGISNSQLIGSHTMKRVSLKLKRDVLESQINSFLCCFHSFVSTSLCGPTLTLCDILVISHIRKSLVKLWMLTYMYRAVIEVSILQLFIIYIHTLLWRACTILTPLHRLSRVASPSCQTMR